MYQTTEAIKSALSSKPHTLRIEYSGGVLTGDQITGCTYTASCAGSDGLSIGNVCAASLSLTLDGRHNLLDQTVTASIGAAVDSGTVWLPLGTFKVSECKVGDDSTTMTAYDAAYWALGGDYVPTVQSGASVAAVLSDLASQAGVTLAVLPETATSRTMTGALTGHTLREMAGFCAALLGCNCVVNRNGQLAMVGFSDSGYSVTADDYYSGELALSSVYNLGFIAASVTTKTTTTNEDGTTSETENTVTLSTDGTGAGFQITNPYMTQTILNAVWDGLSGLSYTPGSCSFYGGILLEPGDFITVTDKNGGVSSLPVLGLTLSLDGGCRASVTADGDSQTATGAGVSGSIGQQVSQLSADFAKFKNLTAENATITNANIQTLKTEKITADRIDVNGVFAQDITAIGTISGIKLNTPVIVFYDEGEEYAGIRLDGGRLTLSGVAGLPMQFEGARAYDFDHQVIAPSLEVDTLYVSSDVSMPMKLQCGIASVTTKAGTTVTKAITFDEPFLPGVVPAISLLPASILPNKIHLSVSGVSRLGFTIQCLHDSLSQAHSIHWIAVAP